MSKYLGRPEEKRNSLHSQNRNLHSNQRQKPRQKQRIQREFKEPVFILIDEEEEEEGFINKLESSQNQSEVGNLHVSIMLEEEISPEIHNMEIENSYVTSPRLSSYTPMIVEPPPSSSVNIENWNLD